MNGLHDEVFLPLIAGVSFGGFYLYATPIIYLPKSLTLETKIEQEFKHVKDFLRPISPQSLNYSPSPQPLPDYFNNESSAHTPLKSPIKNPDDNFLTRDSSFKYMPILKRLTSKNMIPIYDYELYSNEGGGVSGRVTNPSVLIQN